MLALFLLLTQAESCGTEFSRLHMSQRLGSVQVAGSKIEGYAVFQVVELVFEVVWGTFVLAK